MRSPVNYVIDADIKGFFDNVKHEWMIKFLEHRISDKNFVRLIVRILRSGVMEEGKYLDIEKGTPQGGVISPILSNIYLHYVLDLWVEKKMKKQLSGYCEMVRYADDFIICVEKKEEAEKMLVELQERLNKFGLTLSEEKTRIVRIGKRMKKDEESGTFEFLGFMHFNDKTRGGKYKMGRKTSSKKFRMKIKGMHSWLKENRCKVDLVKLWKLMSSKLIGHYRYYGISGNSIMINKYYYYTKNKLFYWLNRRSQKNSFCWESFKLYIKKYPLPKPKIYVNMYTLYPLK